MKQAGLSRAAGTLLDWAGQVGADPRDSPETALQKQVAVALCVGTLPLTALWSAIYFVAGVPLAAAIPAFYTLFTPLNTALFAWTRNIGLYRFSQLLIILLLPWLVMLALGGFGPSSMVIIWATLCPLCSLLLEELRQTMLWIVGFLVLLVAGALLQPWLAPPGLPEAFVTWFFVLNIGAVTSIIFGLLYYFVRQRNFFQERSESLLLNILPRDVSETLKREQRTIATHHPAASILFADVVNFTPMAAAMTPLRLVELLNEVFHCFDGLVDRYGVEKIKTIGDCYMVAAGVPVERPDHASALASLALDMQAAIDSRTFGGRRLAFRIGINSGPVVAGVIGRKKFIYDLWGEAVNLASRMESHGQSGTIQITRGTFELIKDEFDCRPQLPIMVKGAGYTEVWHIAGRRSA
ncbi:MAG: adenylate/guanylate cyclase domain-containing protein [Reyranella sp.]|uniref:adenylate/guanylate cyclase domain-containing protein n=1 Tax=Reyranella sp. TaxID=1929291 RepID=UPI001AC2ECE6|nr:adenylate/guanylate cyclase domain-containing protein [Reyranella sp.]MBN9086157.1 adenylate/guanylate cyclase domain-containing protein [Reyranella sp.]